MQLCVSSFIGVSHATAFGVEALSTTRFKHQGGLRKGAGPVSDHTTRVRNREGAVVGVGRVVDRTQRRTSARATGWPSHEESGLVAEARSGRCITRGRGVSVGDGVVDPETRL